VVAAPPAARRPDRAAVRLPPPPTAVRAVAVAAAALRAQLWQRREAALRSVGLQQRQRVPWRGADAERQRLKAVAAAQDQARRRQVAQVWQRLQATGAAAQ
jgi:hypothetical protein